MSASAGASSSRVRQDAEQELPQRRLLALSTPVILADGDERARDEMLDRGNVVDLDLHAPPLPSYPDPGAGYFTRQPSAYIVAADRSGRLLFRVADPASDDGPAEDESMYLCNTHAQRATSLPAVSYSDLGVEAQPRHSVGLIADTDVDPLGRGLYIDIQPLLTSTAVRMRNFCGERAMAHDHGTTAGLHDPPLPSYLVQQPGIAALEPGDFTRQLFAYIVAADSSGRLLIRVTDPGPAEDDAHRATSLPAVPNCDLGVEAQPRRSVALVADNVPLHPGYYMVDFCPRPRAPDSALLSDDLCGETGVLARAGRLYWHAEASRLIRFVALPDDCELSEEEMDYEASFAEVWEHESYAPAGLPHEEVSHLALVDPYNHPYDREVMLRNSRPIMDAWKRPLPNPMRSFPGEFSATSGVVDRVPAEQTESFTGLFRELRGGSNHVAVEFSATIFAGLYKRTAAHDAVVGIPIELHAARGAGVSDSEEECEGSEIDHLSNLPDHLIYEILSRLPLVDIVRTSVLGRSWREVWTFMPSLEFDDMAMGAAGVTSFLDFVDGVLARCCDKIQRFVLTVAMPCNIDGPRLAAWAAQAADRVTGSIIFQLDLGEEFFQRHTVLEMPDRALAQSVSVSISHPEVIAFRLLAADGNFARLTDLFLAGARFTDGGRSISHVVSTNCPMLIRLRMEDVRGVFKLHLTSHSLKDLSVLFMIDLSKVEINASRLNRIKFAYSFGGKEDTELSLFEHRLEEILWSDIWPVRSHFGQAVRLEKLRVHRLNNSRNLQLTVSQFRAVKTIYVLVSEEEDTEEVRAEIYSMRKPRGCEVLIQLSEIEE